MRTRKWNWILLILVIIVVAALLGRMGLRRLIALISKRPDGLGVTDGKLAPCPASPNCVSTQSADERHRMQPIPYTTSAEEARKRIVQIIRSMERTRIVTEEPYYVYAEFQTPGLQYTDDVEFYLDEEAHVIHFRSAARLPYWDWDVNRKRMENIQRAFQEAQ